MTVTPFGNNALFQRCIRWVERSEVDCCLWKLLGRSQISLCFSKYLGISPWKVEIVSWKLQMVKFTNCEKYEYFRYSSQVRILFSSYDRRVLPTQCSLWGSSDTLGLLVSWGWSIAISPQPDNTSSRICWHHLLFWLVLYLNVRLVNCRGWFCSKVLWASISPDVYWIFCGPISKSPRWCPRRPLPCIFAYYRLWKTTNVFPNFPESVDLYCVLFL